MMNKTEFVREHMDLPAAEIVKLAAKKGEKLTVAHVHTIRSQLRKKGGAPTAKPSPRTSESPVSLKVKLDDLATNFVDQILETLRKTSVREIIEG